MRMSAYAQSPMREQPPTASTYIDPAGSLTIGAAVAQALDREPSLRATRSRVDAASGMRQQAELRPNPSVVFSQQGEPAGTDNQTRVEVQWPLDLFRKTGRVAVADREVDAARQSAADRERILAADVRMKYGEVAAAVRALSVIEDVLTATDRQRSLTSDRVDQGAAPPLERDMLRLRLWTWRRGWSL